MVVQLVKKILLIGPDYFGINNSVADAFSELGNKVIKYNFCEKYPVNPINRVTHGLLSKFKINYFINKYDLQINNEIIKVYNDFLPDIVFIIKGHKVLESTLVHMNNSKLILWMMDSVERVPKVLETIDLYNLIYVFEEKDVNYLKNKGVLARHLPLALDNKLYNFNPDCVEKKYDITFIGSLYQERIDVLKEIIDRYPNKNIFIKGFFPSWKISLRNTDLRFGKYKKYFSIASVKEGDVSKIYSKSRVILNLHQKFAPSGTNLRFFEIAGTKSVQIVNNKSLISKNFDIEPLLFESYDELFLVIDDIFKGEIDMNAITEKLYHEVTRNHTFTNRAKKVLNDIMYGNETKNVQVDDYDS